MFRTTDLVNFRDDGLASLLYVQNWWGIIDHRPYFEEFGRPSPFMHLWSLAIEEQFYLLWPIALAAALRYLDKAKAFAVTLVLAGASVWAMAHMADIERIERSYYGTDTRAFGLLLGAAMAFVWKPGDRLRAPGTGAARLVLNIVLGGRGGRAGLAAGGSERVRRLDVPLGPALGRPPVARPGRRRRGPPYGHSRRRSGLRPLAAIGRRSYSLYLWHWPVIVFMRPGEDMPVEGWTAHLVRIAVMVALAELSYRLVEQPFRTGRVPLALPAGPVARWRSPRHAVAGFAVAAALVLVVVAVDARPDHHRRAPSPRPVSSSPPAVTASSTTTTQPAPTSTTPPSTAPTPPSTVPAPTTPPTQPPTTAPSGPASSVPVSVIGESVTLAAEGELEQRFTTASIDAAVGRQFSDTESLVAMLAAAERALAHRGGPRRQQRPDPRGRPRRSARGRSATAGCPAHGQRATPMGVASQRLPPRVRQGPPAGHADRLEGGGAGRPRTGRRRRRAPHPHRHPPLRRPHRGRRHRDADLQGRGGACGARDDRARATSAPAVSCWSSGVSLGGNQRASTISGDAGSSALGLGLVDRAGAVDDVDPLRFGVDHHGGLAQQLDAGGRPPRGPRATTATSGVSPRSSSPPGTPQWCR